MNKELIIELKNAVIKQLNCSQKEFLEIAKDVCNYGAGGGFNGFIYTEDTVAFFKKNKELIIDLLKDFADRIGEDLIIVIKNFRCLKDLEVSSFEIAKSLLGSGKYKETFDSVIPDIQNALAWFTLEEVSRRFIIEKNFIHN